MIEVTSEVWVSTRTLLLLDQTERPSHNQLILAFARPPPRFATRNLLNAPTPAMKTIAIFASFTTFAAVAAACSAASGTTVAATNTGHSSFRQLQFFPPTNNQPDAGAMEAGPALAGNWNSNGLTPTGNEADAVTDATATATTTAPQGASAGSATGAAATATAPTTSDIAPGQPTIMVILPDFLAAHSGWSSYTDDVGETTDKKGDAKPVEETPKSAASMERASSRVLAAFTLAVAVMVTAMA